MILRLIFILGIVLPATTIANPTQTSLPHDQHLGTSAQQQRAWFWNHSHIGQNQTALSGSWPVARPFSEIENTGFVAISGADEFELSDLRKAIAKNLPQGVVLVVYVQDASDVYQIKSDLGAFLTPSQLKFLVTPGSSQSDPIWARDSLPFPVYLNGGSAGTKIGLVDSLYPQNFEPDAVLASALSLPMTATNQYFRGGNLLFDLSGNCFAENVNEVTGLTDANAFFKQYFGCATVTLLKQEGGIGDIDERIKFLGGNSALTDNDTYAGQLKAKGYSVTMIPSTGNSGETYMNTLVVNGTIFVPQMGLPSDAAALAAYQKLGFKPVGVMTKAMADQGDGNIHCVTMNYPPGTFTASPLGVDFVTFL